MIQTYRPTDNIVTDAQLVENVVVTTGGGRFGTLTMDKLINKAKADTLTEMEAVLLDRLTDGCFILYHRTSDGNPLMVKPSKWKPLERSNNVAIGVVIISGGKHLVVSPTGSETTMSWVSTAMATTAGGFTTTNRFESIADFSGRANTTAQLRNSQCSSVNQAAGFCNAYSRLNSVNRGLPAGSWWLPSLGEMYLMFAFRDKINAALAVINGAQQLDGPHWSSTEASDSNAWQMYFSDGFTSNQPKTSINTSKVRPVSANIVVS